MVTVFLFVEMFCAEVLPTDTAVPSAKQSMSCAQGGVARPERHDPDLGDGRKVITGGSAGDRVDIPAVCQRRGKVDAGRQHNMLFDILLEPMLCIQNSWLLSQLNLGSGKHWVVLVTSDNRVPAIEAEPRVVPVRLIQLNLKR